jgi:hypothetical protein
MQVMEQNQALLLYSALVELDFSFPLLNFFQSMDFWNGSEVNCFLILVHLIILGKIFSVKKLQSYGKNLVNHF